MIAFSITGNRGSAATLAFSTALALVWLGGMTFFGIGALLFDTNRAAMTHPISHDGPYVSDRAESTGIIDFAVQAAGQF